MKRYGTGLFFSPGDFRNYALIDKIQDVADYPAYMLPTEINRAYLNHEISIRDVYVHWRKRER